MMIGKMPLLEKFFEPDRVVVSSDGYGCNSRRAYINHAIKPDIIFLRHDGWTLGAPKHLEAVAYRMWQDEWTHFTRKPFREWIRIEKYGGPA